MCPEIDTLRRSVRLRKLGSLSRDIVRQTQGASQQFGDVQHSRDIGRAEKGLHRAQPTSEDRMLVKKLLQPMPQPELTLEGDSTDGEELFPDSGSGGSNQLPTSAVPSCFPEDIAISEELLMMYGEKPTEDKSRTEDQNTTRQKNTLFGYVS